MSGLWPWLTLFGLGAFHGINPAMGWLFAVGLGLQEQKRTAVLRALPPIALGHALSIGIIIAAVLLARISVPGFALKIAAAAILFCFWLVSPFSLTSPELGRHACGFRRIDSLVFCHGVGPWRGFDANSVVPQITSTDARKRTAVQCPHTCTRPTASNSLI